LLEKIGSRIRLKLGAALDSSSTYEIEFENIDTPEVASCSIPNPSILIVAANQYDLLYASASNLLNSAYLSFELNNNLGVLGWQNSSDIEISELTLRNGIYSAKVKIVPLNSAAFPEDITITESTGTFTTLPSTLSASRGDPYIEFRIAFAEAPTSTAAYTLKTVATSGGSLPYLNPPRLIINVDTSVFELTTEDFSIPVGGFSLPLIFDLGAINAIPVTNLTIATTTITSPGNSFTIEFGASLLFNENTTSGYIVFAVGESAELEEDEFLEAELTLGGANADSYAFSSSTVFGTLLEAVVYSPRLKSLEMLDSSSKKTSR